MKTLAVAYRWELPVSSRGILVVSEVKSCCTYVLRNLKRVARGIGVEEALCGEVHSAPW